MTAVYNLQSRFLLLLAWIALILIDKLVASVQHYTATEWGKQLQLPVLYAYCQLPFLYVCILWIQKKEQQINWTLYCTSCSWHDSNCYCTRCVYQLFTS